MNTNKIIAPIYLVKEYKTKKNKNISLTMNWYRNAHFIVNNEMKKQFKEIIWPQLIGKTFTWELYIEYDLYRKRMSDLDNWQAVVTKYFQDALVEYKCIVDDDFNYIRKNSYEAIAKDKDYPRFEITIKQYKWKNI